MLLELILGLELSPGSAESTGEQDVALFRFRDAATIGHVRVDPINVLSSKTSLAIVAGVNLQVLGQRHESALDELLSRLALGDGRVGPLQVVENLPGFDELGAGTHLHVATENVVL